MTMASKSVNWTAILADFVKPHPKASATIAFNLGVFAAQAAKRKTRRTPARKTASKSARKSVKRVAKRAAG